jgi:hypothetical protein
MEVSYVRLMTDRTGPDMGYDITVNGVPRTFRDRKSDALEAALFLKAKGQSDIVKIHDRHSGREVVILPHGRLG